MEPQKAEFQSKRVAAYMRVSKRAGMTVENQRPILENWIKNNVNLEDGYSEIHWFVEQESTRNDLIERQKLRRLFLIKEYDTLLCVRIDRWGRSTVDIVSTIQELIDNGIRTVFVQNAFDWNKNNFSSMNKFQLDVISAFANLEREIIRERTNEGLDRARLEGKRFGRPPGSKDSKTRRKSGYWLRWERKKMGVNNSEDKKVG